MGLLSIFMTSIEKRTNCLFAYVSGSKVCIRFWMKESRSGSTGGSGSFTLLHLFSMLLSLLVFYESLKESFNMISASQLRSWLNKLRIRWRWKPPRSWSQGKQLRLGNQVPFPGSQLSIPNGIQQRTIHWTIVNLVSRSILRGMRMNLKTFRARLTKLKIWETCFLISSAIPGKTMILTSSLNLTKTHTSSIPLIALRNWLHIIHSPRAILLLIWRRRASQIFSEPKTISYRS